MLSLKSSLDNFSFQNYFLSSELKKNTKTTIHSETHLPSWLIFIFPLPAKWWNPSFKSWWITGQQEYWGKEKPHLLSQNFIPSSVRGGKAHEIARHGTGMTFFNRNTGISWAPRDVPHSMESKRIKAADRHIGGLPILLVLFLVLFCHLVFAGNAFQKRWV